MADYQAQIRLGVEGLGRLNQLNSALERATELFGNLENAQLFAGQIGQSAQRNLGRARRRMAQAGNERRLASRSVENVSMRRDLETGRFVPGGGTLTARRLANRRLNLAERETREAARNLRSEEQNRRLISAQERRYAIAAGEAADAMAGISDSARQQQARFDQTMRNIGQGSRGNYLTNLFQGRQQELARGGGGRNLSPELQQQARNARAAWDLATAGGRENLQLMQRLATEMAGLVRQQNEFNRARTGRAGSFEVGRRGQERITELSRMAGADPAVIRRLRSRATEVISAGNIGDTATSKLATLRMNAAIDRYRRELIEAASQLQQQKRTSFRNLGTRQNWQTALMEGAQMVQQNRRALPSKELLAERIARTPGGVAPTRLDELKIREEKAAAEEAKKAEKQKGRYFQKLEEEQKRQAALGIGVSMPERIGGPRRRVSAVAMGGGADSGIMPRALPSKELLAERIALSGQRQPTRLDELQAQAQQGLAKEAEHAAGRLGRFAAAVEREEKRRASLGIGAPERVGGSAGRARGGAIPMGGQGGRPGMFNQYPFPAGPGNAYGAAEFKSIRRAQQAPSARRAQQAPSAPGFFRGDPRKAIGEGLIGGAFPLLFGQGVGASVGGLAGGVLGGAIGGSFGFGLSLIGTAVGSAVDATVGKLGTLGGALSKASDAIAELENAGFRVRDSQKIQVAQLEKVGRGYEAQKVVLGEIESRLGPGSVAQIDKLNNAQKELSDSWAALTLQIGVTFIPAIVAAAGAIEGLLGGSRANAAGANPVAARPRKPSDVLADLDAAMALNEAYRAGNREYAGLVRDVEDWRRDNEEKIFDMRRKAADIEKEKTNLRLDAENKIFDMRQETAKLEIDNARSRAQLAIETFDLELAQRSDVLGGRGGELIDQVRQYLQARDQGESELQAKEKTAKLQIAASERQLQQYILQVADKVAGINRTVEDYKRDQQKFRFEASRRAEDYRIKVENYIYDRFKERYEYAIGSEREILQIRMQAAASMGAMLPPDAGQVLGGAAAPTAVGASGLANPLGPQRSGRPPNWNQGLGAGRGHQGQDLGVDVGTTIHAIEDAVVEGIIRGFSRDGNPRAGDAVMLRYLSGQLGVYGHVKPLPNITPGQRVAAGQQIGTISDWGQNTHLHYELWKRRRGAGGDLLDPTQRLRGAMRAAPGRPPFSGYNSPAPATQPPFRGYNAPAPATTPRFRGFNSSAMPDAGLGNSFLSLVGDQNKFGDVAMSRGQARAIIDKFAQEAIKKNVSPDAFVQGMSTLGDFAQSPDESRRLIRNAMSARGAGVLVNTPGLASAAIRKALSQQQSAVRRQGVNPDAAGKHIGPALDIFKQLKRDNLLRKNVDIGEVKEKLQEPLYGALMDWIRENLNNPAIQQILNKTQFGQQNKSYGSKGLLPILGGFRPESFGVGLTPEAKKEELRRKQEEAKREIYEQSPAGKREAEYYRKLREQFKRLNKKAALPSPVMGFDVSRIEKSFGDIASIASDFAGTLLAAQPLVVEPFKEGLPTYAPAPMATPAPPAGPVLPAAPAPMVTPDTGSLTKELGRQKDEILENIELVRKLQELENGRLLLQLGSSREVRDRLNDAARELFLETELLGVDRSLAQSQQEIGAEKIRTAFAARELNNLEEESLGFAKELLDAGKLQQQEYDRITQGIKDRIGYEKELLEVAKDRAEVARQEAFNQRYGETEREIRLTGAGLRGGLVGVGARAFEAEMALSGNLEKAGGRADQAKRLEDQQLVWNNLEKNIIDVSDAISGALTNGLLDIISGAREIEDVGRDMLNGIARSFADSAQQQLTTLMQRQLAQFAGPKLAGMLGAGAGAAGPQALGLASLTAAGQVAAFGAMLQTVMGQMALSGAMGGLGSAPSLLGSALPTFVPGLSPTIFGGFLANGGTTRPGEAYVVGDGGEPEFFFPGVTGRVVPQSDMQKAAALREESEGDQGPIDIRYTVTEQAGQRYVTEEQFRKGMAETAKRSYAMTKTGLRNNKNDRDYVGI